MVSFVQPIIGMIGVTASVWVFMYTKRLSYISKYEIDPTTISTPEKLNALLPDKINLPSNNFKNLFEMPVLFYTLCLTSELLHMQELIKAPDVMIKLAWSYVVLRALHSIVHCTYNKVMHRFTLYFLSSIILWVMAITLVVVVWR